MVSRQLHELKVQRDSLLRGGNGQPFSLHVEVAGIEKMIARLEAEINAYGGPGAGNRFQVANAVPDTQHQ